MRESSSRDEFFQKIFACDLEEIEYVHHPSDEVLQVYLRGYLSREWRDPDSLLSKLKSGDLGAWRHQEVSAHLLTCGSCRQRAHALQGEISHSSAFWTAMSEWMSTLWGRLSPIPRPALATIAVEFAIIVGLVGVLFLQPAPLFTKSAALGGLTSAVAERRSLPQAPTTSENNPTLEMAGVFPLPVTQAMQTLSQDPNPDSRLAAVRSLKSYTDYRLVEPLSQVFEREQHPEVRQAIAQTLTIIWTNSENQFSTMARTLERIREQHHQEFQEVEGFQLNISIDLGGIWQSLRSLRTEARYPYEMLCSSQPELTLGQLTGLASELDGVLVIDRSLSRGDFRLRLPLTLGAVRTIDQLESQLGVVCRK